MLPKDGNLNNLETGALYRYYLCFTMFFARLVYYRISTRLFQYQSRDKHVFTPLVRIEDVLLCVETTIQYAFEFNVFLLLLSMGLRKAFDTVDHRELFRANVFRITENKIYSDQMASVHGSRNFNISRGV